MLIIVYQNAELILKRKSYQIQQRKLITELRAITITIRQ